MLETMSELTISEEPPTPPGAVGRPIPQQFEETFSSPTRPHRDTRHAQAPRQRVHWPSTPPQPRWSDQSSPRQQWPPRRPPLPDWSDSDQQPQQQWHTMQTPQPGWSDPDRQPQQQWHTMQPPQRGWSDPDQQPQQQWHTMQPPQRGWSDSDQQPQQQWHTMRPPQPGWQYSGPSPTQPSQSGWDMSKFLLKREMITIRLTLFDDTKPENYPTWKSSFLGIVSELDTNPRETLELLLKHLGPTAKSMAEAIKNAEEDPYLAMQRIWDSLDSRYGHPEILEASITKKVNNLSIVRKPEQLYNIVTLCTEIAAAKRRPSHAALLSYYDSPAGLRPIIKNLPASICSKWMSHASKFKREHDCLFPPFEEFLKFIKDMCSMFNDPSLNEAGAFGHGAQNGNELYVKKTDNELYVKKGDVTYHSSNMNDVCPYHLSEQNAECNHSLKSCRSFRRLSYQDKLNVFRKNKLCYRCCKNDHVAKNCKENMKCDVCDSPFHCTVLHFNKRNGGTQGTPQETSVHVNPEAATESSREPMLHHTNKDGGTQGTPQETSATVNSEAATESSRVPASTSQVVPKCTQICGTSMPPRSCSKTVLVKVKMFDKVFLTYAIIDDQSNRTLATPSLFDMIGGECSLTSTSYTLTSCNGKFNCYGRMAQNIIIKSLDEGTSINIPSILECEDIPNIRSEIPTPDIIDFYPHMADKVSIPPLNKADIGLLIGRDVKEAHVVEEQIIGPKNSPLAVKLSLGWVIIGEVCLGKFHSADKNVVVNKTQADTRPSSFIQCPMTMEVREKPQPLFDVFETHPDDEDLAPSVEDEMFFNIINEGYRLNDDGKPEYPLPFKPNRPKLPNNRVEALKRAKSLAVRLSKDPTLLEKFSEFMNKTFARGHAEKAPPVDHDQEVWYLPIFPVVYPQKNYDVRPVFDSKSKFRGLSLNSVLLPGPNMMNKLLEILIKFRCGKIGVMADVEQMFYGFYVPENQRDYLRFFWHKDNDPQQELIEYRMKVHVFGNCCSPAIATHGLRQCVKDAEAPVKRYVEENFYVDDGLDSFDLTEDAISVLQKTKEVLWNTEKHKLHKIVSNDVKVMSAFSPDELTKNLRTVDLSNKLEKLPMQKSLGIHWDITEDTFTFSVSDDLISSIPNTRRKALSVLQGVIYDPLNMAAPFMLEGRLLMRKIVKTTKEWDTPLDPETEKLWRNWMLGIPHLNDLSIPRMLAPVSLSSCQVELHVFSDASQKAIAACAYTNTKDENGNSEVRFVYGKSKVAPTAGHTIVRLELCAAVLATDITAAILPALPVNSQDVIYHTDSMVVLGYIYNTERRFQKYVNNRVSKIHLRSQPAQWRYVPTDKNPADDGTRNLPADALPNSKWINGPAPEDLEFHTPLANKYDLIDPELDKEIRSENSVRSLKTNISSGTDPTAKFSNWRPLVRAISLLRHNASCMKKSATPPCVGWHVCTQHKTPEEMHAAEIFLLRKAQEEFFSREIQCLKKGKPIPHDSSILKLTPKLDENGLLRLSGRLRRADISNELKYPIIIPGKCNIAKLLIKHHHEDVRHQGRHITAGAVRSAGFWIVNGKKLIADHIFKCVKCRILRRRLSVQQMGELQDSQLSPAPPFSFVGVDAFGPWEVCVRKTRGGSADSKRHAIIFVCKSSRAAHIELVCEMSSSSFINAMRRFEAIRGHVTEYSSDRGTNFVGAADEIEANAIYIEDPPIVAHLNNVNTTWKFNPPHSSHMNGGVERMIKIARGILNSLLRDNRNPNFTHEVLSTFMAEVTAIMNSRPLVPVSTDPENPLVLSPSMLLTQKKPSQVLTSLTGMSVKDAYRAQWKHVQFLADTFWARWKAEYLPLIQVHAKWPEKTPNVKEGDVVLALDKETPRLSWPIALIDEVYESEDGAVRKVKVGIMKDDERKTYVRPITDLVLLTE